jgi:hypothetical protein
MPRWRGRRRSREPHRDTEAAFRAGAHLKHCLVGLGDGGNDRQPEAKPLSASPALDCQPLERPQEPLKLAQRHDLAAIGHSQLTPTLPGCDFHLHVAARLVVTKGVVDQV